MESYELSAMVLSTIMGSCVVWLPINSTSVRLENAGDVGAQSWQLSKENSLNCSANKKSSKRA